MTRETMLQVQYLDDQGLAAGAMNNIALTFLRKGDSHVWSVALCCVEGPPPDSRSCMDREKSRQGLAATLRPVISGDRGSRRGIMPGKWTKEVGVKVNMQRVDASQHSHRLYPRSDVARGFGAQAQSDRAPGEADRYRRGSHHLQGKRGAVPAPPEVRM